MNAGLVHLKGVCSPAKVCARPSCSQVGGTFGAMCLGALREIGRIDIKGFQ